MKKTLDKVIGNALSFAEMENVPMGERLFRQGDVNKIFGHVPSRTLRWWALSKLYDYASEVRDGRGVHRQYLLENLYQIGIVEALTSLKFQASQIVDIMTKQFHFEGSLSLKEKMEGILLIAMSARAEAGTETRLASSWHSSLPSLLGLSGNNQRTFDWNTIELFKDWDNVVMVNLSKIKERVDNLVASIA